MADMVQRVGRKPEQRPKTTIGQASEQKTSPAQQQWAINLSQTLEAPLEKVEAQLRSEMGMNENCEDLDQPASNASFLDMSGPLPDDDFYDYGELDREDNPVADPDGVIHGALWEKNDFEALSAGNDPEPLPDIIMDEFGNVEIPRESLLDDYYVRLGGDNRELPPKGLQLLITAERLRAVAEALIEKEGETILSGEADFSKIKLLPLTQKEIMAPLGMGKELRSKMTNRYVKTPYWGILHLSVFFQGAKKEWRNILDYVRKKLKGEDLENPYANRVLWNDVKREYSLEHKDDRQLRNKLMEAGIPLKKPRNDIHKFTKKWQEKGDINQVQLLDIPGIRVDLQKKFDMFSTKQTLQCREKQYIPFVEERMRAVLQELGVKIT